MENNESEEWRSIEGYEGLYEVSNLGRIKSCDRYVSNGKTVRLAKGRALKPCKNTSGYLFVRLSKMSKESSQLVHRLVGLAFQDICGQYVNGLEIDHKNCCRDDNRAENLHWVTRIGNMNNPITKESMGGENAPWFGKFGKEHHSSIPILQYNLQGKKLAEFEGLSDAGRELGIGASEICAVLKGRRNHTHGFIFRYKEESQNKAI